MSEWQMPQKRMSMRTSSERSARRSTSSGASGASADATPTAWAVVVDDRGVLVMSVIGRQSHKHPCHESGSPCEGGTDRDSQVRPRHALLGAMSNPRRPFAALLGLLTVFGPISMDLYLPVLP